MRVFQNAGLYRSYLPRLRQLSGSTTGFESLLTVFMNDRFGAAHTLLPALNRNETAFFTNGDDEVLQRSWARENGLPGSTDLIGILRAQIESHRTEVLYNMDPMRYGSDFVRNLPGSVKVTIAWRAAPSPGVDFSAYDFVVCNFPGILRSFAERGWKAAYFAPAHDPVMDEYAASDHRPIDVLFTGTYSRHHQQRARLLDAIARLSDHRNVVFHLDESRATRLAESATGLLMPLGRFRRPKVVRRLSRAPVFGRDLYAALARSKVVVNCAIDMAGLERGNMRCWEALGCGSLMVSDAGNYPAGMVDGVTMRVFSSTEEAVDVIESALSGDSERKAIAGAGRSMISTTYSKQRQWADFQELCGRA